VGNIFYESEILTQLNEGTTINGIQLVNCITEDAAEAFLESISDQIAINDTFDNENWRDE